MSLTGGFKFLEKRMGSVRDVARCEELSLLQGTWCSLDGFLNVRDARRGDSKAPRDRLQRFIRRAPQQIDGGLVRVAVRTIEYGVQGKSIGGEGGKEGQATFLESCEGGRVGEPLRPSPSCSRTILAIL